MIRYETLLLLHPDCDDAALSMIQRRYTELATEHKGAILSFEVWGKYYLSYPVKKQDYGIYTLVRFELPEAEISTAIKELQQYFQIRCENIVMRFINKRLEKDVSLEYEKPEPIIPGERLSRENQSQESERDMSVDTALLSQSAPMKQTVAH
jgi:ribosomal protein S6